MASYKITAATVEVRPGVTLTVEVSSAADLKQLLADLEKEGFKAATVVERKVETRAPQPPVPELDESPASRIETRDSLPPGRLAAARLIAFKDGTPQLLRPGAFESVSDATLSLLYVAEIGGKKSSMAYDDFKDLYDAQNIKSGSALPVLLTNLRNAGYIDKKAYWADRTIRLTAKGSNKAEHVIKALCA